MYFSGFKGNIDDCSPVVAYGDTYQNSYNIIRFACNLLDNDRLIFRVSFVNKTETSFCDWFFTGDIFIIERWQIAGNLSR